MQIEQCPVQSARLARFHPLKAGQQHPLEHLRVKICNSELQQTANDHSRLHLRTLSCPAITCGQSSSDPGDERLDCPMPEEHPRLLVLQQSPHCGELGTGEHNGRSGSRLHQTAQVVCLADPPEPTLSRTDQRIGCPLNRQGNSGRSHSRPEQPREHQRKIPNR